MTATTLRCIIATLASAAAISMAATPAAHAVGATSPGQTPPTGTASPVGPSTEAKNDHRYGKSVEAFKKGAMDAVNNCADLIVQMNFTADEADKAWKKGDTENYLMWSNLWYQFQNAYTNACMA